MLCNDIWFSYTFDSRLVITKPGGRTYLVGEGVILVGEGCEIRKGITLNKLISEYCHSFSINIVKICSMLQVNTIDKYTV
jgi:hypothetical protein